MKKGQVYEAVVERVDFPNRGVAHTAEGTVIVKNSLPGQRIKLGVNKVRSGKAEGRLLEVIEKSPLETGNPCSHFGVCGGCTYLPLTYEEQLRIKNGQMMRLLGKALEGRQESWAWEGIKGSPAPYEYRNKMEFSFGDEVKDGPLCLGMHKRGSFYDVVTVDDCRIADGDYRLILRAVRDYFAAQGVGFYRKMSHEGYLRHLLVRKASGTGEILAALVTTSQDFRRSPGEARGDINLAGHLGEASGGGTNPAGCPGSAEGCRGISSERQLLDGFLRVLLDLQEKRLLQGHFAGIIHIVNDSLADTVQSDRTEVLYGREYFYEELLGLKFKISTFSFFQTNSRGAEVLYETVREYVGDLGSGAEPEPGNAASGTAGVPGPEPGNAASGTAGGAEPEPGKVVFDLYSGTGTIAQLMAPVARKVIGVEIVEEAVEAARRNALGNGLGNCEFIAGDVLKVLDSIEEKPDIIILDPPRDGVHPKALPKIIKYGVPRIVYISCKPTSLARDLEVFLGNGYRVEKAVAVDQFPWTANCEVVCLLSKCNAGQHA